MEQYPQFSAHVCCGQTAGSIKRSLGREVDLGPGDILLNEKPASPRGTSSQFSAHVCYGQTAGWIKMPLVRDVDLDPGHFVLDRDAAPPRAAPPPILDPCLL